MTVSRNRTKFSKKSVWRVFVLSMFMVNIFSVAIIAADVIHYEQNHDLHDIVDPNKELPKNLQRNFKREIMKEFILNFEFTTEEIVRNNQVYKHLTIKNGGIECGTEGQELQFFKYLIQTNGQVDSISVKFYNSVNVYATPTPYRTPSVIGSDDENLDPRWDGKLDHEVNAEWVMNHLSEATVNGLPGELYSLKMYPVEYTKDGLSQVYTAANVSYNVVQNNYWMSNIDPGHKPTGAIKYLIITHPDLVDTVKPFAEWKAQKGMFTKVTTTQDIEEMYSTGDLQLKMRKYIQSMEQKYDLDYLLLIGDWDKVPTRNTKNDFANPMMGEPDDFASDLYFACVDLNTTWNSDSDSDYAEDKELDDAIPDMANGRLAINSARTLSKLLQELMNREKEPTWDSEMEEAVYTCGDPGYMPGNPTDVMDYFYNTYGKDVFTDNVTIYYDGTGKLPFSAESFTDAMDATHQAMGYFGHGQPTGLPEFFDSSHVSQLASNGTDGSFFAMACLTGWFDDPSRGSAMGAVDNCFAEVLTETPGKGLIGYIGSSRMAVGNIDTTYSDDAPGLEEDYWREIREAAVGNITPTIGTVWRNAITNFASSFYPFKSQMMDNPGQRTFLEYNLLGEPEAPLFLREPQKLQLQYKLNNGNTNIWTKVTNSTGAPMEGVTVCIYRAEELGRTGKTNAKGEVTIQIPPNNGGVINITASKPGDKPVQDTFNLDDNLEPEPKYEVTPVEPDGNTGYYIDNPTIKLSGDEPVNVEYRLDNGPVHYEEDEATVVIPHGEHQLQFRVVDSNGLWSDWQDVKISVDTKKPELTLGTNPAAPDGGNGWFKTMPIVTLYSNEIMNDSYYKINDSAEKPYNAPIQLTEGIFDLTFRGYDLAGNVNITAVNIKVDCSPPKSEINISHSPDGENEYYITSPTIKLSCPKENGAKLEYRWDAGVWQEYLGVITAPEGANRLYYRGIDMVGNVETEHDIMFKVDTNTPNVIINVTPDMPDGENGYYIESPLIEVASEDGEIYYALIDARSIDLETLEMSTMDWQEYLETVEIPEGEWVFYAKSVDSAGNERISESTKMKVDSTPPEVDWEMVTQETNGENRWYKTSPTLNLNSDSENTKLYWRENTNHDWTEYDTGITLTSGIYKLQIKGVDIAGNEYNIETETIMVDTIEPQLNITQPKNSEKVGTSTIVAWMGIDDVSGLSHYKVRLDKKVWIDMDMDTYLEFDTMTNGLHEVTVKAWDVAGNCVEVISEFVVDGELPTIKSKTPIRTDVAVNSKIVITFSEEMKKDTVDVTIEGVTGDITWAKNTVMFKPAKNFQYSTKYTIEVTGKDLYDNSLGDYTWSFETEVAPEKNEAQSDNTNIVYAIVISITVTLIMVAVLFGVYKRIKVKKQKQ